LLCLGYWSVISLRNVSIVKYLILDIETNGVEVDLLNNLIIELLQLNFFFHFSSMYSFFFFY